MHVCTVPERFVIFFALAGLLAAGCAREPTPEERQATQLLQRGRQEISRGATLEARPLLSSALVLEEKLERSRDAAEASEMLGDGYALTASFDSALQMYDRSRTHYRASAQREGVRRLTLKLTALHRRMGEEREAFQMEVEALRLARVFKDDQGIREIQWAMLPSAGRLEELDTEQEILQELTRAYTESRSADTLARLSLLAGRSLMQRKEYAGAAERFLQSTALAARSADSLAMATALLWLGMASDAQGKTVEAFRHYGDAFGISRTVRGGRSTLLLVLLRVANDYLRYSQQVDAQRFYRLAMTTAIDGHNKIAEGYITVQLGHCELVSDPEQARVQFESALSLFRDLEYAPGSAYALASLAYVARWRGELAMAVERYVEAIGEQESVCAVVDAQDPYRDCERAVFGDSETAYYDRLLDILLSTGRHDEAFWYAERRARSALLRVSSALRPAIRDAALHQAWTAYQESVSRRLGSERLYRELLETGAGQELIRIVKDTLRQTAQALARSRTHLAQLHPPFAPLVRTDGVGITEVQQALTPDAALISFVQGDRTLYAHVVTRERAVVRLAAVDRVTMTATAGDLLSLLGSEQADSDSMGLPRLTPPSLGELIRKLSEWFIRPIAGDLPGKTQVIVVLPPELAWLPLHIFRLGAGRSAPFFIERYAVSYLPSASAMLLEEVPGRPVQEVVALGYRGGTAWDIGYELRDIRAFYKDVQLHLQDDATLERLLSARGDLLHLALDLRVTDLQAQTPWMVLADGKMPGLSLREGLGNLTGLSPFVGIVVSSLRPGVSFSETLVPLVLLSNGTGTVVMNGFVPTRKAKRFFGEMFYTELLAGSHPREAAQRAILAMLRAREYASPSVWGAFVIWGGNVRASESERLPETHPAGR
jgi:CHAT domain-containing protein